MRMEVLPGITGPAQIFDKIKLEDTDRLIIESKYSSFKIKNHWSYVLFVNLLILLGTFIPGGKNKLFAKTVLYIIDSE